MAGNTLSFSASNIEQSVNSILESGYLSRQEYLQLMNLFLSDFLVTDEQRSQMNRIFDELQRKRLQLTQ